MTEASGENAGAHEGEGKAGPPSPEPQSEKQPAQPDLSTTLKRVFAGVAVAAAFVSTITSILNNTATTLGETAAICATVVIASLWLRFRNKSWALSTEAIIGCTVLLVALGFGIGYIAKPASKDSPIPSQSPMSGPMASALSSASPSPSPSPSLSSAGSSSTPSPTRPVALPPPTSPTLTLTDPGGSGVAGIAYLPNGMVAAGDLNGNVYLWNPKSGVAGPTLLNPSHEAVFSLAASPDGELIAAGTSKGGSGIICLWDAVTGKLVKTLTDPDTGGVSSGIAFSPDSETLAADDDNGGIYLWNLTTFSVVATLHNPNTQSINAVAFSPSGILASADNNGNVYLWNPKTSTTEPVATLDDPGGTGTEGVAFSADGSLLAAGDNDGEVYVWNVAQRELLATLKAPAGEVASGVAFTPDDAAVAATFDTKENKDPVIEVWDVSSHDHLATFQDPASQGVFRFAISSDGSTLAVGDANAHTYIWSMGWIGS